MEAGYLFQIGVGKTVMKHSFGNGTMSQTSLDLRILARVPAGYAGGAVRRSRSTNGRNQQNGEPTTSPKNVPSVPDAF